MTEKINLEELAKFLVEAKRNTYASVNKMKIKLERPSFDELEYENGIFYYRDSYSGFFQAPGMEVVRIGGKNGKPIWTMAYYGGMLNKFNKDIDFAKQVFNFLKKALKEVPIKIPFRGPINFKENNFEYINNTKGDITRFIGHEKILYKGKEVFNQDYGGGLIINK